MDGAKTHSHLPPNEQLQVDSDASAGDVATLTNSIKQLSVDASKPSVPASGSSPNGHRNNRSQPGSPTVSRKASIPLLQRRDDTNSNSRPSSRRMASASSSPRVSSFGIQAAAEQDGEKPKSASVIASEHLQKQLTYHSIADSYDANTIVIVNDACYGHRYARPKTSKSTLSMIVERPERLRAGLLGISSAYVRIGQIHSEGKDAPHPNNQPSTSLPFRIHKTDSSVALTSPIAAAVHGSKWMQELRTMCEMAESKLASGSKELSRPDTPTGTANGATKPKLHEGDLYLCGESLNALQSAMGGVCDAVDAVFGEAGASKSQKKAFVGIRPPGHHCSSEYPSGFCWINNIHVGIEHAAQRHGLTHAAIIDFDLHHGDGSQAITWERNIKAAKTQRSAPKASFSAKKTTIGYFSLHDVNSYPCEDGDPYKVQAASTCIENAHGQNIWNVHLQPWTVESDFWKLYETRYILLLDKARAFLKSQSQKLKSCNPEVQPKAAIFISAGFDASEWEMEAMQRHKVNVPTEFYARFTTDIVEMSREHTTSVDGRVISVLEGGYSDRALTSGIMSHLAGLVSERQPTARELSEDQCHSMDSFQSSKGVIHWDKSWWSQETLAELEGLLKLPAPPPPPPKKIPRSTETPTYSSPTQSYTAKVVDPSKVFRSASGSLPAPPKSRPTTPPTPEVSWATSACELCKILLPSDRKVDSHTHEDLKEPRVKRGRQSSVGPQVVETSSDRMQLRGRKPKSAVEQNVPLGGQPSDPNRRRTISDLSSAKAGALVEPSAASILPPERSERPSTSGPGAQSANTNGEYSSRPASNLSNLTNAQRSTKSLNVPKTRRTSGVVGGTQSTTSKTSSKLPPIPSFPQQLKSRVSSNSLSQNAIDSQKTRDESRSDGIEAISSGVKKITLRMSKQENTEAATNKSTQATSRSSRKPTVKDGKQTSRGNAGPASLKSETQKPKSALSSTSTSSQPAEGNMAAMDTLAIESGTRASVSGNTNDGLPQTIESTKPSIDLRQSPHQMHISGGNALSGGSSASPDGHRAKPPSDSQSQSHPGQMEFIPYSPPGPTDFHIPNSDAARQPLTWLPPNSATPEKDPNRRDKENLPVFPAYGPIPFAKVEESAPCGSTPPELPARVSKIGQNISSEGSRPNTDNKEASSIWDVPETPQK